MKTITNFLESSISLKFRRIAFFAVLILFGARITGFAQDTTSFTSVGAHTWTAPYGVDSIQVLVWGAGGSGAGSTSSTQAGGGGGGGAFTFTEVHVTPGTTYNLFVGAGGTGGSGVGQAGQSSWFLSNTTVLAVGGGGGIIGSPGATGNGGQSSLCIPSGYLHANDGGDGGYDSGSGFNSGGGGGGAGCVINIYGPPGAGAGDGRDGYNNTDDYNAGTGGEGVQGVTGPGFGFGGNGAIGVTGPATVNGTAGSAPGGGGSGGITTGATVTGGAGGNGQVVLVYFQPFYWTGNDFTNEWKDPGNWDVGTGWPGQRTGDVAIINGTLSGTYPELTSGDGTISVSCVEVSGAGNTLTLDAGAYLACYGTGSLGTTGEISGILTPANGTIIADPASTIEYSDYLDQQIIDTSFTYGNLYLSYGGFGSAYSKSIRGSLNIAGSLVLAQGVTVSISGAAYPKQINVSGNVQFVGSSAYIVNDLTCPVVMNGNGATINTYNGTGRIGAVTVNANVSVVTDNTYITNLVVNSGKTITVPTLEVNNLFISSLSNYGNIAGSGLLFLLRGQANPALNFPDHGTNDPNLSIVIQYAYNNYPCGYGEQGVTINASTTVTFLEVQNNGASYPGYLNIASGATLNVAGDLINDGIISGPGSLALPITTNIPAGDPAYADGTGIFDPADGSTTCINSAVNLIVGNGSSGNTVTVHSPITLNTLTINSGSTLLDSFNIAGTGNIRVNTGGVLSIANGVIYTNAANLYCSGTVQNAGTGGTLSLTTSPDTLDGGTSGTHGQINLSTLKLVGSTSGQVSSSGTAITLYSGTNFVTGSAWNGKPIQLSYYASGSVNTSGTAVTFVSGTPFLTGSVWNGQQIYINSSFYTIASVTDEYDLVLTTSAGTQSSAYFNTYSIQNFTIASVTDASHLTLTTSAGTTPPGYYYYYGVNGQVTVNTGAYLDFGASTLVYSNLENQNFINNGTIKFNGNAFGYSAGNQSFLSGQTYQNLINSSTGKITVLDTLGIGNSSFNDSIANFGTISSSSITAYLYCKIANSGIVHCTGSGGISSSWPYGAGAGQVWTNESGSSVDVAGPFFTDANGGTLQAQFCTNTVIYDGTSQQVLNPTTYNNLTVGSAGATLADGNITVTGVLTGGGNIILGGNQVIIGSANTSSTTNATACNSYVWNNTTYTSSTSQVINLPNAAGCDSTATLNLTINHSSTSSTTVSTCGSYTWNGTTYTGTGTYTYDAGNRNSQGCDSIATLNLTITGPCLSTVSLSLKLFIQGYYRNFGSATPMDNLGYGGCLFVSGVSSNAAEVDTITISIEDPNTSNQVGASVKGILHTDGTVWQSGSPSITLPGSVSGHSYYIKITHRNAIQTWSGSPVMFSSSTSYDFSTGNSNAYGNNMALVDNIGGNPVYALWSGDVYDGNHSIAYAQDGVIESGDYSLIEEDYTSILFGYYPTDVTGDGVVESADYSLIEENYTIIIFAATPW